MEISEVCKSQQYFGFGSGLNTGERMVLKGLLDFWACNQMDGKEFSETMRNGDIPDVMGRVMSWLLYFWIYNAYKRFKYGC